MNRTKDTPDSTRNTTVMTTVEAVMEKNSALEKRLDSMMTTLETVPEKKGVQITKYRALLMLLMIFGAFATLVGLSVASFNMAKESHVVGGVLTTSDGHTPVATAAAKE